MRLIGKAAAPSNFLTLPDILDGAHAVALELAAVIGGVDHGAIDGRLVAVRVGHLLAQVAEVDFVVAILAARLKVDRHACESLGLGALDGTKVQLALGVGGELLVVGRRLACGQHVVGVAVRLEQGVLARVSGRGLLALD